MVNNLNINAVNIDVITSIGNIAYHDLELATLVTIVIVAGSSVDFDITKGKW